MAKKFLTGLQLLNLTSDPATGIEGELYYNTQEDVIKLYSNGSWSKISSFSNISTSPSTQLISTDSNSDTLTFISGENISISADSSTDSITINSTGNYTSVDSIQYPDYIAFDTSPETTSASVGTIAWDSGEGGPSVQLDANINVTLGQEIIVLAKNGEGTTLNKGEVVRLAGAQGQKPKVMRAYNTSDAGSATTFGIVAESIASGAEGFVVTQGVVKNINTNAYNEGDILYLSATPGQVTTVKPQAPNHYVFVGVVTKKNSSSGRIYVKPQNGYELDEIHDVRITSIQNDDLIVYNSASSIWVNSPKQNIITTASAAAAAYVDAEISSLTTSDIEEGSNLYYTDVRALNSASTALVHGNHNNIVASYNSASSQIILSASVSSGAAIANTDLSQPNANSNTGLLYFNPNDFTFSIAYGGTWLQIGAASSQIVGGNASTSEFDNIFDGGNSSSTYDSYLIGGNS
jgi:hypothetical protein